MAEPRGSSKDKTHSPPRSPTYAQALMAARPAPINTNIWGSDVSATGTSLSGLSSVGQGNCHSALTTATSLFSPSIWSPVAEATQSATIPNKLSWEQSLASSSFMQQPNIATPSNSKQKNMMGLGLRVDTTGQASLQGQSSTHKNTFLSPATATFKPASQYQFQQNDNPHAKTSPYGKEAGDPLSKTFPLPQNPFGSSRDFANQHRILPKTLQSEQSPLTSPKYTVPIGNEKQTSHSHDQPSNGGGAASDSASSPSELHGAKRSDSASDSRRDLNSNASVLSEISAAPVKQEEAPVTMVIPQVTHPMDFNRFMSHPFLPSGMDAAFPHAYNALKTVNPEHFTLPGDARVICIKTEFITNIHWAVQRLAWGAMEKVGLRIMRVWEEAQKNGARVFFIMSVNGQKSYCGLAEMTSEFKTGGNFSGWTFSGDRTNKWGIMPLKWHYIKNVSYSWFADIHHSHNSGPIINMWNGMHFPGTIGHEVIRRYAQRPHFTNILCWEKRGSYLPLRGNTQPEQIDPTLGPIRGAKGGRGVKAPPTQSLLEASATGDKAIDTTPPARGNMDPPAPPRTAIAQATPDSAAPPQAKSNLVTPVPTSYSSFKGEATSSTERKPQPQSGGGIDIASQSAVKTVHPRIGALSVNASLTPPTAPNRSTGQTPQPGQLVTCIVDEHGNYVPVSSENNPPSSPSNLTPSSNTPRTVVHHHTYYHTPQLHNGTSPTPSSTRGRGVARVRGATRSSLGNVYSSANSIRSSSGTGSFASQPSFGGETASSVIRRMQSEAGFLDALAVQHNLGPVNSNPSMGTSTNGQGAAIFQQAAPAAPFLAQQPPRSPYSGSTNNPNIGTSTHHAPIPAATSFGLSGAGPVSSLKHPLPNKPPAPANSLPGLGFNATPAWNIKAPTGSQMSNFSFSSNEFDAASVSTEDSETRFTRACLQRAVEDGISASNRLAAMNVKFRNDPHRMSDHAKSERCEGSATSKSPAAKATNTDAMGFGGRMYDDDEEEMADLQERVQGEIDRLIASPPVTICSAAQDGGVPI